MAGIRIVKISKAGHVFNRELHLEKRERVLFDGPERFKVKLASKRVFGRREFDQDYPLTGRVKPSKKREQDYTVWIKGKQTDPRPLKASHRSEDGEMPPGPIIVPPPCG